jgi:hypothetical protein
MEGITMPTLSDETRHLRLHHTNYWCHFYLRAIRHATVPVVRRAYLARLRFFQQQAKHLMVK